MSSVPQAKQELYEAITLAFEKIVSDYSTIPDGYVRVKGVEGNIKGTEISVSDTLAYLIGWGRLVLKWYDRMTSGKAVDFPETGYKWSDLGKLAQDIHSQYQEWEYDDLLSAFKKTTNDILTLVESLSEQELYGANWYEKYTLGRMIQFNTSSPMKNMRTKVRKFKRVNYIS
jgi:hypothetical protein